MFCFCSKLQEQNKTEVSSQKIKLKKKSLVTFLRSKLKSVPIHPVLRYTLYLDCG